MSIVEWNESELDSQLRGALQISSGSCSGHLTEPGEHTLHTGKEKDQTMSNLVGNL